jgi:hypothetical protein
MSYTQKVDWANRSVPGSRNYKPGAPKRRTGPATKDSALTRNTTIRLSKLERAALQKEKARLKREEKKREKSILKAQEDIRKLQLKAEEAQRKAGLDPSSENPIDNIINEKMLADLRWVYGQVDGRKKLLDLVKADDKQFAFIVKEMLRLESEKANKRGGTGNSDSPGFFVVIRGLEDEQIVDDAMKDAGNVISVDRVSLTMPTPEGDEIIFEEDIPSSTDSVLAPQQPQSQSPQPVTAEGDDW